MQIPPKEIRLNDQGKVFLEIWKEREHISFVSGEPLNYNFHPSMFFVFSHVLSKGSCPALKLVKEFIVLMTMEEHRIWENYRYQVEDDPKWSKVFELFRIAKKKCGDNDTI